MSLPCVSLQDGLNYCIAGFLLSELLSHVSKVAVSAWLSLWFLRLLVWCADEVVSKLAADINSSLTLINSGFWFC